MSTLVGDSEEQRVVDRIRANAYREAMEAGATFINRKWIANKLHRSARWVTDNWKKGYESCFTEFGEGRPLKLSQESRNIIDECSGKRRRSCSQVAKIISEKRDKAVHRSTVQRYRERANIKPFHVIPKPMLSPTSIENRLWFVDFLQQWTEDDFMHLAPSDEFFIWAVRRPNHQNDRVWALTLEEIEDNEHYQQLCKKPKCIGIFICFTALKMEWVIKEDGASWNSAYYQQVILRENVIPFLSDPENVIDTSEVVYLHDSAPCHRANASQQLLKEAGIDFFDSTQWPGNSPDLNATEHLGAIIKDRVENLMLQEHGSDRYSQHVLHRHTETVLQEMQYDTVLFEELLRSYPKRLQAVREANGRHTHY